LFKLERKDSFLLSPAPIKKGRTIPDKMLPGVLVHGNEETVTPAGKARNYNRIQGAGA